MNLNSKILSTLRLRLGNLAVHDRRQPGTGFRAVVLVTWTLCLALFGAGCAVSAEDPDESIAGVSKSVSRETDSDSKAPPSAKPSSTPKPSVPLTESCGYRAETGSHPVWPGRYQGWVKLSNVQGTAASDFELLLVVGNSRIVRVHGADYEPAESGYSLRSPSWLKWQPVRRGRSYSLSFSGIGRPREASVYVVSINGRPCDQISPTIHLQASGSLVTSDGKLTLTAEASDNVAVLKVLFEQDGVVIGERTGAPYTIDVPVSGALNGRHQYRATAIDPSGNRASDELGALVAIGNRFIGTAVESDADYAQFTGYFDQLTPANAGKWGSVEATRDQMNWAALDKAYQFAKDRGLPFKLHTLIWGQQQPTWLGQLTEAEQLVEIEQWMQLLAERYPDADLVDVVNEPLHAPPAYKAALGGDGETGWDWVIRVFELARRHFPHSELILNDYSTLILPNFTDDYLKLIALLQDRHLIDGIGEQGHFLERAEIPVVASNLGRLAATGLPIYISELDVNIADDAHQAQRLSELFQVFWQNPSVLGITFWGYLEGHVWRPDAFLVRQDGTERPALKWLNCYLAGGTDCVVPEYVPQPWLGTENGVTLEAEEYDDGYGVAALGGVVAYTDGGDWISYSSVVFRGAWNTFSVTYSKGNEETASVSVHLDSLENPPVLTAELAPTGDWNRAQTIDLPWTPISGAHAVYVRFNSASSVANLDRIRIGIPRATGELGPNLIANADFESGSAGWFTWGGTLGVSNERVHGGAQSLVIRDRSEGGGTAAYDLTSGVQPGVTYQASVFATIAGGSSAPVYLTVKTACSGASDAYTRIASSDSVTDAGWTRLEGSFTVPDCELTQVLVYAEGPPAGVDLYLDDAYVGTQNRANLVSNGDFESGVSGWFGWGGSLLGTSERAHGGARSLLVAERTDGGGTAAYDLTASVSRAMSYDVTFFVTVGGAATAPANITAKVSCAGQSDAYTWVANSSAVADGVWSELTGTMALPDCELSQVLVFAEGPPAGVNLYVDDVVVTAK